MTFSKTPGPRQGFEEAISGGPGESSPPRPEDPQDKSQAPGKEAPEGQRKGLSPKGGGGPQRVCTLGFRVLPSVDSQAYAGCVALGSMGGMENRHQM